MHMKKLDILLVVANCQRCVFPKTSLQKKSVGSLQTCWIQRWLRGVKIKKKNGFFPLLWSIIVFWNRNPSRRWRLPTFGVVEGNVHYILAVFHSFREFQQREVVAVWNSVTVFKVHGIIYSALKSNIRYLAVCEPSSLILQYKTHFDGTDCLQYRVARARQQ